MDTLSAVLILLGEFDGHQEIAQRANNASFDESGRHDAVTSP